MEPEHPEEAGVTEQSADSSHQQAAHLPADQARERLETSGFTVDQILARAETYLSEEGSGTVDSFVTSVEERQQHPR